MEARPDSIRANAIVQDRKASASSRSGDSTAVGRGANSTPVHGWPSLLAGHVYPSRAPFSISVERVYSMSPRRSFQGTTLH